MTFLFSSYRTKCKYFTYICRDMELHKKQIELLRLLTEKINDPLTVREMQIALDLSSPSLVQHHIIQLEKKKFIKRNPNNPRDYKILNDPDKLVSYVNLYGSAQCGPNGTLLSGEPIDRMALSPKMISFNIENAFMVKAVGDSMEPNIHEGDFIIVEESNVANDGDIVVCSLDEAVMIKKLHTKNRILVSLNQAYEPIIINEDSQFLVEGIVKGIICNHKLGIPENKLT